MSHRRWTLNEWSTMFKEIYEIRNLSLSPEKVLHRLIEETAELVKPVLTLDLKELRWCLADIIAWVCAFANKCKIDLQEIMLKYVETPPGKMNALGSLSPDKIIGKSQPETFEDWQRYLGYIYRSENQNITPELIISKLIEDVGVTSRSLRTHKDISLIKKNLAGVLAWTIALANKFQMRIDETTYKMQIDDIVYEKYPYYCHRCKKRECRCFKLSIVFISYTTDTKNEMTQVRTMIENRLNLKVEVFEKFEKAYRRMRMVEAFNVINRSDGAVILLKNRWSENVWAELVKILEVIDEDNVWICAQKTKKKRQGKLQLMIKDIEHFHRIDYYSKTSELTSFLEEEIMKRIKELKQLEATTT